MLVRILKKDLRRNRLTMSVLFAFVLLASMLAASSSSLAVGLMVSIDSLFSRSRVPHFMQMHAGDMDETEVVAWSRRNPLVEACQIVEMANIDGSRLSFSGEAGTQGESVMDIGFVGQNASFDFLIDMEGEVASVARGKVAVPVVVAGFIRDSQMNPAVVHSKRFLVNSDDFRGLREKADSIEHLIEFRLHSSADIPAFIDEYRGANLPSTGPNVDYRLFKLLNGMFRRHNRRRDHSGERPARLDRHSMPAIRPAFGHR